MNGNGTVPAEKLEELEELEDERDGLEDWLDDPSDEEEPVKKKKKLPPKYKKSELDTLRTNLFIEGSDFKETHKDEIIGINNVLVEIDQLIFWLQNSQEFGTYKARLEPGVLFEGNPGTGKTLVSRYIATESNALFINIRDFAHNGAMFKDSDIRDLFRRARETYAETGKPILLFWDEFETGAKERSNASPEQAAAVSQLTAELDGVHGKNEGVLLIGCTNYMWGIDRALRRSGRMGFQIEFSSPDRAGKKKLLEHYVGKYATKGKIDMETISYFIGENATAASIEESCMEAWRVAVAKKIKSGTRTKPKLSQDDLIEVFLKRLVGPPTAFIDLPKEDRAKVAVHEIGHAIMALVFDIPLRLVTVQPGKKSLGKTIFAKTREHIGTFDELVSEMRVAVGSVTCERASGLPQGIGSTGDVVQVNQMAVQLVDDLHGGVQTGLFHPYSVGKSRSGGMEGGATPSVSDRAVEMSDNDVQWYLKNVEQDGEKVFAKIGEKFLWEIADEVNERVTLTGVEFADLFMRVTGQKPEHYRPASWMSAA